MQNQKIVSWNNLHSNNIYLFTIVSNNTIVRTVSNINRNADFVYSRKTIKYNIVILYNCVSIISDFDIVLTEIVKDIVALLQNINSIYKS